MSKTRPENRRALAFFKRSRRAVTEKGKLVTGDGLGKHTKGKVSAHNKKKNRK